MPGKDLHPYPTFISFIHCDCHTFNKDRGRVNIRKTGRSKPPGLTENRFMLLDNMIQTKWSTPTPAETHVSVPTRLRAVIHTCRKTDWGEPSRNQEEQQGGLKQKDWKKPLDTCSNETEKELPARRNKTFGHGGGSVMVRVRSHKFWILPENLLIENDFHCFNKMTSDPNTPTISRSGGKRRKLNES